MGSADNNLIHGFISSVSQYRNRPALYVRGEHVNYEALGKACANIASAIPRCREGEAPLAALFAHRSVTAYSGVLGILASGRGYVPLNPKFPIARNRKMFLQSQTDVIVVGEECLSELGNLIADLPQPLTVLLPFVSEIDGLKKQFPQHHFISAPLAPAEESIPKIPNVEGGAIAYLLFTSGSTGEPKGVSVSHANVRAYIDFVAGRYDWSCEDRFSHTFDLTFDLSVHDMFVAWQNGACLYCLSDADVVAPARFIRDQELTVWFSAPSAVSVLLRLNLLRPGLFSDLRYSFFCGEPLTEASVVAWQNAATKSTIENFYGPTEATIAITSYRWIPGSSPSKCRNGIVPIGWAFRGQRVCVTDSNLNPLPRGKEGELLLSGSQITGGYWKNPEETSRRYVRIPEMGETVWYRTGDLVLQTDDDCLLYLGRSDDQVKIRGFRAELQEIEWVLREATGSDHVVSLAWPLRDGTAEGVVAFVSGISQRDESEVRERCQEFLPDYMVPRKIYFQDELPLNTNGKVDRVPPEGLVGEAHE